MTARCLRTCICMYLSALILARKSAKQSRLSFKLGLFRTDLFIHCCETCMECCGISICYFLYGHMVTWQRRGVGFWLVI